MHRLAASLIALALLAAAPAAAQHSYGAGFAAYERGDFAAALAAWRPLAEQGSAAAQYSVGVLYERGEGVPRDDAAAAAWYRRAAEQGAFAAQHSLAILYAGGRGVPQDHGIAADWFHQAAAQGYAAAQTSMGILHELGLGVPPSLVLAHMWLSLAAAQGMEEAGILRAGVAARMAADELAESERLARAWTERHGG